MTRTVLGRLFLLPIAAASFAAAPLRALADPLPEPAVASAIEAACEWLVRHQAEDGRWDIDGFDARCHACAGYGTPEYDVGATGLALEALVRGGSTHETGPHARAVVMATAFLIRVQREDGCIGDPSGHYTYNHAIATRALALLRVQSRDADLDEPVRRAADYLLAIRNDDGGWRYQNYRATGATEQGGTNDTSITAWCVTALLATRSAGLAPDGTTDALDGANAWLDHVRHSSAAHPLTYGYTGPQQFVYREPFVTTACGVAIRHLTSHPEDVSAALPMLLGHTPDPTRHNFYEWYWSTVAATTATSTDGRDAWNRGVRSTLLRMQDRAGGCASGSWDPIDTWGQHGGRVYATAMAALCLETQRTPDDPLGLIAPPVEAPREVSPEDAAGIARLVELLADASWEEREAACAALAGHLRANRRAVREILRPHLDHPDPEVRARIEILLGPLLPR